MEENIYAQVKEAIRKNSGIKDPAKIAAILGIEHIPLYGSLAGYAAYYNEGYPVKAIGLKEIKDTIMWQFGGFHEIGHVLFGDIFDKSLLCYGTVPDFAFLQYSVESKNIPYHEKRVDIFSADVVLEDKDVMITTGCDRPLYIEYQEVRKSLHNTWENVMKLRQIAQRDTYDALLIAKLKKYESRLIKERDIFEDIEFQIVNSAYCKTAKEAAYELGTEVKILGFKIEGMRQRGINIPQFVDPEKLNYRDVFKNII